MVAAALAGTGGACQEREGIDLPRHCEERLRRSNPDFLQPSDLDCFACARNDEERVARAGWVICPSGTMRSVSYPPSCARSQKSTQNPCAKNRISLAASTRFHPSRSAAKNIPLLSCGKPCLPLTHPASCRGAYASSRYAELRAAMDAEATPDEREPTRTAKSCGPGAPRLALNWR
jgi:hypothetical protein